MNFDHIFIITYGRSGSTLLQGVLNSIPGVLIRGENNAALRSIIRSWSALSAVKGRAELCRGSDSPSNAWYGLEAVNLHTLGMNLAEVFKKDVLKPSFGTKVSGFKEIRYYPFMCPDLDTEINFMRRFFRRSGFILNTRDLADVFLSNARHQKIDVDQIRASDARLREIAARGHSDTFHIHYDDYKANPEELRLLFEFLGASFDISNIRAVLSQDHSTVRPPKSAHVAAQK